MYGASTSFTLAVHLAGAKSSLTPMTIMHCTEYFIDFLTNSVAVASPTFSVRSVIILWRVVGGSGAEMHEFSRSSIWWWARRHTERASGSDTVSTVRCRSGMISGRNGAASRGSSTSLDMFMMILQVWRRMAVWRSRRPRMSSGTRTLMAALVTGCTKVVAESLKMHASVSAGRTMQPLRSGRVGSISLLPTQSHAASMAAMAAFFTSALVSVMAWDSTGTRTCICRCISRGAESLKDAILLRARMRVAGLWDTSTASMKYGSTLARASGWRAARIASTASAAGAGSFLPPAMSMRVGSVRTMSEVISTPVSSMAFTTVPTPGLLQPASAGMILESSR
mmetsp:Transcript_12715/g.38147  ORF Transcript_12715/g.38147 Transcript_12715/m.38147 type:complete len:338 (-) Transcript_12715:277-1290(-)